MSVGVSVKIEAVEKKQDAYFMGIADQRMTQLADSESAGRDGRRTLHCGKYISQVKPSIEKQHFLTHVGHENT